MKFHATLFRSHVPPSISKFKNVISRSRARATFCCIRRNVGNQMREENL